MARTDVNVCWEVIERRGWKKFTLDELGCKSMKQWRSLYGPQKQEKIQNALDKKFKEIPVKVDSWIDY